MRVILDLDGTLLHSNDAHAQAFVEAGREIGLPVDEAATRAGIRVIALRTGGWAGPQLRGEAAIYDGPADLLDHYDASPLG